VQNILDTGSLPEFAGLEMLALFLRDAAVLRGLSNKTGTAELTFGNLEEKIRGVIATFPHANYERALLAVDQSVQHLTRGYSKDMVLYALAVQLNTALGPWAKTKRPTLKSA
jgi:hypothetical protein